MTKTQPWVFSLIFLTTFLVSLFIYLVRDVCILFGLSFIVAFFLNPSKNYLMSKGLPKAASLALLFMGLLFVTSVFFILLLPPLFSELILFFSQLPSYIQTTMPLFIQTIQEKLPHIPGLDIQDISLDHLKTFTRSLSQGAMVISETALKSFMGTFRGFFFFLSILFFTGLYLVNFERVTQASLKLIPFRYRLETKNLCQRMGNALKKYLKGQIFIILVMGLYYAFCLEVLGINHGFALGMTIGVLAIIPYVGFLIGALCVCMVSFSQGLGLMVYAYLGGIFAFGAFFESYILVPKVLEKALKISPLWGFFAFLCCGYLFGFMGIILAMPLTAVAHVLLTFLNQKYRQSSFYQHSRFCL